MENRNVVLVHSKNNKKNEAKKTKANNQLHKNRTTGGPVFAVTFDIRVPLPLFVPTKSLSI